MAGLGSPQGVAEIRWGRLRRSGRGRRSRHPVPSAGLRGGRGSVRCRHWQEIWRFAYKTAYRDDFGFDEGPRAVPVVANGRIYTFGAEGQLHAMDAATGKAIWNVDTMRRFGVRKGFFGAAGSPLVEDGRVIANVGGTDGTKGAGIVAFNADTGAVLWTATDHQASYSSPVGATFGGKRHAVFFTRGGLVGLDPATGAVLFQRPWRSRSASSVNAATPLIVDDVIFASATYETGALALRVNGSTLTELWSSDEVMSNHYATSVYSGGYLYGYHGRQEFNPSFRAVDLKTGAVKWSVDRYRAGSVTLAGDKLLIARETGELVLAAASPEAFRPAGQGAGSARDRCAPFLPSTTASSTFATRTRWCAWIFENSEKGSGVFSAIGQRKRLPTPFSDEQRDPSAGGCARSGVCPRLRRHPRPSAMGQTAAPQLPSSPMTFGVFVVRFSANGTFMLEGQGWPSIRAPGGPGARRSTWSHPDRTAGCDEPGRYRFRVESSRLSFDLVFDDCVPRRMIFESEQLASHERGRGHSRTAHRANRRRDPGCCSRMQRLQAGSWPSFRGPQASGVAEGQNLPDQWDARNGENTLWRTPIPGLAHSSPIVWDHRIFLTSAISTDTKASFRRGQYGDGDASNDLSRHQWMVYAIDKRNGKILWERVAHEGEPVDKRHIKSTYASSTPATDGRVVVASFGSQGVHAYDVDGRFLWRVDLGRLDLGAYDIPTFEWGPASSPIIWNGLVILQCDTQADSFLLALNAETGETVWKTERDELPSWGTPTVAMTPAGPELVTNAANFIRGYDPRTGKELWRLGGSSKITAPTPIFGGGLFVVASGRAPEAPIFVVRPGARGDVTLPGGQHEQPRHRLEPREPWAVHADAAGLRRPALRRGQQRHLRCL